MVEKNPIINTTNTNNGTNSTLLDTSQYISPDAADKLINKIKKSYDKENPKLVEFKETELKKVCNSAIEVFKKEKIMVKVSAPIYVIGDIHGQFTDLIRIFDFCGYPETTNYLFLGDYVDRGKQSLETITLLFLYKIRYPERITILRGNHECASINKIYGFYDECKKRLSVKTWKMFCDVFLYLPFCGVIEEKIFCCHGGIGPDLLNLSQLNNLKKPCDIPDDGILCDLCWADPSEELAEDFGYNERGVSVTFSANYVKEFIESNNLDLICRAHQVIEEGYEFFANQSLVTVFSAPNYTGEFDNDGAIMYLDQELLCSFNILKPVCKSNNKGKSKKKSKFNL